MAKTQKIRLIATATAFVALSLPRSSNAQITTFSWTGYETIESSESYLFGPLISTSSGTSRATLTIGIDFTLLDRFNVTDIEMDIDGSAGGINGQFAELTPPDPFGPTSASGSFSFNGGPAGSTFGNFFLTYESILPNRQLDVGNGIAVADLTTVFFNFQPGPQGPIVTESFATFTTVPEPPSGVLAGLAFLVIAAVAWMRGFRRRLQARLS
jgi:hypothetical protein